MSISKVTRSKVIGLTNSNKKKDDEIAKQLKEIKELRFALNR
jgi:hypothetical protein